MEPGSPALHADSLPCERPGKLHKGAQMSLSEQMTVKPLSQTTGTGRVFPGIEPVPLALQADSLPLSHQAKLHKDCQVGKR